MTISEPLIFIQNPAVPQEQICAVCFEEKNSSDRRWATHVNSKLHIIHVDCWKKILENGYNCCPLCRIKVDGGDVLKNVRYIAPRPSYFSCAVRLIIPDREGVPSTKEAAVHLLAIVVLARIIYHHWYILNEAFTIVAVPPVKYAAYQTHQYIYSSPGSPEERAFAILCLRLTWVAGALGIAYFINKQRLDIHQSIECAFAD